MFTAALDGGRLCLGGRLERATARALSHALERHAPSPGGALIVDLKGVDYMDSAAIGALLDAQRRAAARGSVWRVEGVSDTARRALSLFRLGPEQAAPPPPTPLMEAVGEGAYAARTALGDFLQLAADTTFALADPRKLRLGAFIEQCVYMGSQALPIVGLIAALLGLTLAFQSAYQLRQFGADIYVANLTGIAMVREMGPLMTAILVAGRSGSSIAAEIATMQVSEEIDALKVMGLDPIQFLALPRLAAIILVVPLLTLMADLLGVFGGYLVGVLYLDLTSGVYISKTIEALAPGDLLSSMFKSLIFGWGIGLIGLHFGFQARGGAGEVGRTTTASVVASIFYLVIAGCFFSVLFYVVL